MSRYIIRCPAASPLPFPTVRPVGGVRVSGQSLFLSSADFWSSVSLNCCSSSMMLSQICSASSRRSETGGYSGDTILVMAVCAVLTDDRLSGVSIRDQQGFLNDPRMLHFHLCHARRLYTLAYFVITSIVSPEYLNRFALGIANVPTEVPLGSRAIPKLYRSNQDTAGQVIAP